MDNTHVRRHHLSVLLSLLLRDGPRSRVALAEATGLTKSTVSQLVTELLDRGLVDELETPRDGRRGRPATDVAATGRRVGGLGLEVAANGVAAAIVDLTGEVRARRTYRGKNRNARAGRVLDRLRKAAHEVLGDADVQGIQCVGATLALPGLIDPRSGTLLVAPNLHWFSADIERARQRLDLPVELSLTIDNEANLAALAELRYGAGRGLASFVYVSGGVGIGAGLVLDGQLVRGAHGFAGELGHVVIDPAGLACTCGARGCLETIAGSAGTASASELAAALATALRSLVHILDPEAVLLGGTLAALGDDFTDAVREQLHAITLGAPWAPCAIRRASLAGDATLIGAATVALDRVLADPSIVQARECPKDGATGSLGER